MSFANEEILLSEECLSRVMLTDSNLSDGLDIKSDISPKPVDRLPIGEVLLVGGISRGVLSFTNTFFAISYFRWFALSAHW